ncbi:hypothetical protein OYC64_001433 [Pagothenia borchgrevinki]|uniref:Uncharacterized protein n=1 Tax=Pagothenia borchgrevinki TaxID=8213 RepID=A0ABD2GCR3_PAGBO
MFLSLFEVDGLLVAAEGMGIDRILLQFMRVYSEQGSLVLLLNTTTPEQEYFTEQLRTEGVTHLPRTVTSDVQSAERYNVYTEGGVLFRHQQDPGGRLPHRPRPRSSDHRHPGVSCSYNHRVVSGGLHPPFVQTEEQDGLH